MKIRIAQEVLLPAIQKLQSIAATKNTLPVLANVLIDARDGEIVMTATDLEVGLRLKVAGTVEQTGAVTIPARKLGDLTRQLPAGEEIRFEATANHQVQIECARSNFRIYGLAPDEFLHGLAPETFPKDPSEGGVSFTMDAALIRTMAERTRFAASTEETRYFLNGVYFHMTPKFVRLVATDSRRLAMMTHEVEDLVKKDTGVILPLKAVDELLRTFGDEGDLRIALRDNQIAFSTENTTLISRLIEGEYPNYGQIVSGVKDNPITVTAARESLLATLARVSLFTNPKTASVRFDAKENTLLVSASSQDFGEAKDEIDASTTEPIQIAFNVRFITDALRAIETDEVRINLKEPTSAGVIRPADDESNYLCLIMPMRLE